MKKERRKMRRRRRRGGCYDSVLISCLIFPFKLECSCASVEATQAVSILCPSRLQLLLSRQSKTGHELGQNLEEKEIVGRSKENEEEEKWQEEVRSKMRNSWQRSGERRRKKNAK